MLTAGNILSIFETHGVPAKGIWLDFLPCDLLVRQLTSRFSIEFAIMFTINGTGYFLYAGDENSIRLPILLEGQNIEVLLKHTHPRGTPHPSNADVNWLIFAKDCGSPQTSSVILPIGRNRIKFNATTPTFESLNP